jgi:hypothetical protein
LTETDPRLRDLFASSIVVSSGVHLSADGSAERLRGDLVSGNYFRVLGISARIGRTRSEDDDRSSGAHPVVVLSDAGWRRSFGSRTDIVGQPVRLNGYPYTVIGVTGEGFFGTRAGFTLDLWAPLSMTSQIAGDLNPSRNSNYSRTDVASPADHFARPPRKSADHRVSTMDRRYSTFLFDLTSIDPSIMSAAAMTVVMLVVIAAYMPARRALRIEPLVALRDE